MITKMIAIDWRAMKIYQIRFLIIPIIAFVFGWAYSPLLVIPTSVFMYLNYSMNPFAVEDKGALNNLYLTLPVKRSSIVAGRYALSCIMLLCGITMGILIMPLTNKISLSKWYIGVEGYMVIISLSYLLYAFLNLFMFPMFFKLGYNKGKFWGIYLPCILFGILIGVYFFITSLPGNETLTINFIIFASKNMLLVNGGIIILATILLITSYAISIKIYSKRNF